MGPVAINIVPILIMDYTVHQDAIVFTRIATIKMAVTRLEEVFFYYYYYNSKFLLIFYFYIFLYILLKIISSAECFSTVVD